jgi:hypothetical protein
MPEALISELTARLPIPLQENFRALIVTPRYELAWKQTQLAFQQCAGLALGRIDERTQRIENKLDELVERSPAINVFADEILPSHRLELQRWETSDGLVIALMNPENAALEDCYVILRELHTWSSCQGTFIPQKVPQPIVLLRCRLVAANARTDVTYLVMSNKVDNTQLLLQEPGGHSVFLTKEGTWRAELVIKAKHRRPLSTFIYFEWTPGDSPKLIPEPKPSRA